MAQPRGRDEDFPEPPRLRRLRVLVSVLILVLIGGVVTVVAALVINLSALTGTERTAITAGALSLPSGEEIVTVGEGRGRLLVVTRDAGGAERLYGFDAASGERVSETRIERD
ncbi:MAG TPA: DUF6476 family protein [Thermohalobaculum sp.]|nr:DUF6476 family protein [Thermohalobaculum sp.]